MKKAQTPPLALPITEWPERDRQLWEEVITPPASPFQIASLASSWSPRRQLICRQAYGQWLSWLMARGVLLEQEHPEERIRPARLEEFVTDLIKRVAPVSVAMMIGAITRVLAVLAPETDWAWLRRIYQDLKAWASPSRNKRHYIVPSADLYALGIDLIETAQKSDKDPYWQATQYRDGLMIALLAARPLRLRNFGALTLGISLLKDGSSYKIAFSADETKNGTAIETPLPFSLSAYLETYLSQHRALLLDRRETGTHMTMALWVSRWGTAMGEAAVRHQIKLRTQAAFGHAIWPHLFRACAATSLAVGAPEEVRHAAALLGHTTFATTEKYYIQAQTLLAGQSHQQAILELRKEINSTPDHQLL